MDKNSLSLFLKKIEWRLVAKIAFVALALLWAWGSDFAAIPLILFVIAPAVVYFSESPERRHFRASFWLMSLTALIAMMMVRGGEGVSFASLLIVLFFAAGVAVEVGLFRFFFRSRSVVFGILHIVLMMAIFSIFFAAPLSLFSTLFLLVSLAFLLHEFFALLNIPWRGRVLLMSIALSFFGVQLALLLRFTPLGFVNASAFMGLLMLLTRDAARAHFEGTLDLSFILRGLIIFLVMSVAIFSVSVWGI